MRRLISLARAVVAIALGALGCVPLAIAGGCWLLAYRLWPFDKSATVPQRTDSMPVPRPQPPAQQTVEPAVAASQAAVQSIPHAADVAAIVERTGEGVFVLEDHGQSFVGAALNGRSPGAC